MPDIMPPGKKIFLESFSLSSSQIAKLETYAALLQEWNLKFNLVSANTLPQIWTRHFLDSAQLINYLPEHACSLADLGSGAGLPGIVLAIMSKVPSHLIESIGKKAEFLRLCGRELNIDVTIHQERIETIQNLKPAIVTARALKPLPELFKLSHRLLAGDARGLFLKGRSLPEELTESSRWWRFDAEKFPSISDPSGSVLIVRNLRPHNASARRPHRRK